MKIISKHQDYYDSVKAYGVDTTCVYVRKRNEVKFDDIKFDVEALFYTHDLYGKNLFPFNTYGGDYDDFEWELFIVGYCGKLYPCIKLTTTTGDDLYQTKKTYTEYAYDLNDVELFLKKYKLKDRIKKYKAYAYYRNFTGQKMEEFFNYVKGKEQACEDLFHEDRIPVFVIHLRKKELVWNEVLKDFKFFKVTDTFTAFQEIAGYVSGVLGGQSPKMIDISDDIMVFKKGFDNMSFRKAPGQKKRRKNV